MAAVGSGKIDARDLKIIRLLREDARRSLRNIAKEVKLSAGSVRNRIARLMEMGIIRRFTIDVDYRRLGYDIHVLVLVTSRPGRSEEIYHRLQQYEEVHQVYWTSGPANVVCVVRVHNMAELSRFLSQEVEKLEGIESVESMFLMPEPEG